MKRKGHRTIPDFSRKQPATPRTPSAQMKIKPPPPVRSGKPPATSVKAGQRGQ